MATLFASSPHLVLRGFVLRLHTLPFLPSSLFLQSKQSLPLKTKPSFTSSRTLSFSPTSRAISQQLENDVALLDIEDTESEIETSSGVDASEGLEKVLSSNFGEIKAKPPILSVKEKKELASYAHSLGKKIKSQQVGKSGVTDTVVTALIETLDANELLKLKIHGTCPGELDDVMKQLEEATGSVIVGQIGRTVILYRPSLAKLKAEEKKKQIQRVYLQRQTMSKQYPKSKRPGLKTEPGREQRQYGGGRRGRSRF